MKLILVALALVAVVAAEQKVPQVVRSEYDSSPEGQFKHSFESDDGTSVSASGEIKQAVDEEGKPVNVVVVRGEYAYVDAEGQKHSLSYTADEDGFHPQSADITVAPARR